MSAGSPALGVAIVSQNAETAAHLREYFESRNVHATALSRLADAASVPCEALVLFPDECAPGELTGGLQRLTARLSELRLVIVTSDTKRFLKLRDSLDAAAQSRFVVLPRPAFSWTLFEQVVCPSTDSETVRGF